MDTLIASSLWQKVTGRISEAVARGEHCEMVFRDAPTELTQVQAEIGTLHEGAVPADGPQVEVHVDGQGGESRHAQPGQHEQVGQHDELQPRKSPERTRVIHWERRIFCLQCAISKGFGAVDTTLVRAVAWETEGTLKVRRINLLGSHHGSGWDVPGAIRLPLNAQFIRALIL